MMGCERQRRGYLGWFILPRFSSGLNQINCLQKISLAFRDISCHNNARFSLQLSMEGSSTGDDPRHWGMLLGTLGKSGRKARLHPSFPL
jgi:hypothetical protein